MLARRELLLSLLAAVSAGVTGCALGPRLPEFVSAPQPDYTQVFERLTVHSSFPLPADTRLFEELNQLRTEVTADLALPDSSTPVVIYLLRDEREFQHFVQTRFPDFPSRRAFFLESDTSLAVYAFQGDLLAEDLRHETTHGYLHAVAPRIPLWLDEGLAEYYELPRAQQGLHAAHLETLQQALCNGRRPSLQRVEALTLAGLMGQADYAECWLWVHWMRHGSEPAGLALREYLRECADGKNELRKYSQLLHATAEHDEAVFNHLVRLTHLTR